MLAFVKPSIARALRDGDKCYAAATYQLSNVIHEQRSEQLQTRLAKPNEQQQLPPKIYRNLRGRNSLVQNEPAWDAIEKPDATGFRGLTCAALVTASCKTDRFAETGYMVNTRKQGGAGESELIQEVQDSDVVCFEPALDDDMGSHAPVMVDAYSGAFPPNTLFRLKEVVPAGKWTAPNGIVVGCRLLIVSATYRRPSASAQSSSNPDCKICENVETLRYANRTAFVNGLDDILLKPVATMEQEFDRDFYWRDFRKKERNLKAEWAYVKGAAHKDERNKTRDVNNEGKLPRDFQREMNDFIMERRSTGHGTSLLESDALLTIEEVLSIRLYSGPCFEPINTFLRQISQLTGDYRVQLAQHAGLTFATTTRHIISGIRKLAAVATSKEATAPLWRGVRGELLRAFWLPDKSGTICATDMGFMSTSRERHIPITYMQPNGPNVLWSLQPQTETDDAFHYGGHRDALSVCAREGGPVPAMHDARGHQRSEDGRTADAASDPHGLRRPEDASDVCGYRGAAKLHLMRQP